VIGALIAAGALLTLLLRLLDELEEGC